MRRSSMARIVLVLAAIGAAYNPFKLAAQNTATVRFGVATADGYVHASLTPENVRVTQNGQPRRVVSVQSPDSPVSTAILVENIPGLWDVPRNASPINALGALASKGDWIAVLQYGNGTPNFLRDILLDFTEDAAAVSRIKLVTPVSAGSSPRLFDAIKDAATRMSRISGRKALVVLTDGCDASQTTLDDLVRQITQMPQLTLSVVDFGHASTHQWEPACPPISKQLSAITSLANGEYSSIALTDTAFGAAIQTIAHRLHDQYAVTYLDGSHDSLHPPRIELVDSGGRPYSAGGKPVNVIAATNPMVAEAQGGASPAAPNGDGHHHPANGGKSDSELPIPGSPPLTKELVDQSIEFFEWLLDSHLTLEQRGIYQDSLALTWKNHMQDDIEATVSLNNFKDQLKGKAPAEQKLARDALFQRLLAQAQKTPNAGMFPWIMNVYYSAHRPIANGNPPLTAAMADAYAEFVSFMVRECLGRQVLLADRQFKNALAQTLAAQYATFSPQQQMQFAEIPLLWEALRIKWPQLTERERANYRNSWRPSAMALLSPQNPGYGASAQRNATDSSSASLQDFVDRNKEKMFVNSMANSSFATTMSLHLNMWH
jgi:hypothetical protein